MHAILISALFAFCVSSDQKATIDFSDNGGRGVLRIHVSLVAFDSPQRVTISWGELTAEETWNPTPDGQFLTRPGDSYPVYRSDSPVAVTVDGIRYTFAAGALRDGIQAQE